jgi:ADP-ribose pyrophosphatase YjhB (NUDIX family)
MYKVFVNDSPIIFTSSQKIENNFPIYGFDEISFDDLLHKINNLRIGGINIYCTNLLRDWKIFCSHLNVIPAAGGLVINQNKEILFIFRNNKWDLPKGWIEEGETKEVAAIREVEEECGISNLKLIKPLVTTYHVYFYKGINLKETYWFLMKSKNNKKLTPQTEEGITKVTFKKENEIDKLLENSYANIKLVYDTYQEG